MLPKRRGTQKSSRRPLEHFAPQQVLLKGDARKAYIL
jgi:hypothetical protein